jgi:hypothetical protein
MIIFASSAIVKYDARMMPLSSDISALGLKRPNPARAACLSGDGEVGAKIAEV